MAKDAHDDPYEIQGTPEIVLECADCGEVGPIAGTRHTSRNDPDAPLCVDDWDIEVRVWGFRRGRPVGPVTEAHEDGSIGYRRTCPRCGGAGRVKGTEGTCFQCFGRRWTYVYPREVRRAARWSQTFQQNRTP